MSLQAALVYVHSSAPGRAAVSSSSSDAALAARLNRETPDALSVWAARDPRNRWAMSVKLESLAESKTRWRCSRGRNKGV
jgi:hypothetical protein